MKYSTIVKIKQLIANKVFKHNIFGLLTDKQFIILNFYLIFKKLPNLSNPKTFSEKIQWTILYGGLDKYAKYVDKIKVRKYIEKTVGKEYTVPLIGVWNNFDEIDFEKLPQQFVLKATHGSGYVYICKDKSKLNICNLRKIVNKWMQEDFYKKTREIQYKYCDPKIICEKYLEDKSGWLVDYKIYCSNGKPKLIEVLWDRFTDQKKDVYKSLNWKTLDISYVGVPHSREKINKPKNIHRVLEIASMLSKQFPFVRVDMYSINNRVYVGELTFTPGRGLDRFSPELKDVWLGRLIDISKYNNYI